MPNLAELAIVFAGGVYWATQFRSVIGLERKRRVRVANTKDTKTSSRGSGIYN